MNSSVQIHPRVIQVLQKQITELVKRSPDGIQYAFNELDILDVQADILGPVGTPYNGGIFRCKLVLSSEFPKVPPKGFFLTKIFHPNVSEKGEICVNTLKKDWDPMNWSLQHIFEVIRCLLIVPFPESALNEEAGKLFMEDYEEYAKHARLITELYAFPKDRLMSKPTHFSPEKPKGMDISFENTHDSPIKSYPAPMTSVGFIAPEPLFNKPILPESIMAPMFKVERSDEVLMPVTNSLNTNPLGFGDDIGIKKTVPLAFGSMMGTGVGLSINTNPKIGNGPDVSSAKKENEKKWKKRI